MTVTGTRKFFSLLGILLLFTVLATPAVGQEEPSTEELVKKTQNPVSDLISVPFQNNFNFDTGSKHRTVWVLNIQPMVPFQLSENWNLVARVIMPVINQPSLFPGMSSATGLGEFNPTFFFAPAKPGETIWGAGSNSHFAHGNRPALRQRKMEHGSSRSNSEDARTVGVWRLDE